MIWWVTVQEVVNHPQIHNQDCIDSHLRASWMRSQLNGTARMPTVTVLTCWCLVGKMVTIHTVIFRFGILAVAKLPKRSFRHSAVQSVKEHVKARVNYKMSKHNLFRLEHEDSEFRFETLAGQMEVSFLWNYNYTMLLIYLAKSLYKAFGKERKSSLIGWTVCRTNPVCDDATLAHVAAQYLPVATTLLPKPEKRNSAGQREQPSVPFHNQNAFLLW